MPAPQPGVSPAVGSGMVVVRGRVALYSQEFADDPHAAYRDMRKIYGPLVPVWLEPEVPATLVVGYRTALQILNDPDRFPADPQIWERDIPDECPAKAMLRCRRNAVRTAGAEHARYRRAIVDALAPLDLYAVEAAVDQVAEQLINAFCESGIAELRGQYAAPLTFQVMSQLLGLPPVEAEQAWADMAAILDGVAEAGPRFAAGLYQVVTATRAALKTSGTAMRNNVITRLITHPADLDDREVVEQLALLLGPGTEPAANVITNTVLLMMTDPRFAGGMLDGSLSIRDAIDEVLYSDTPLMNFCMSYPRQAQLIEGVWLPAHQPVVISMAAANNDPAILPVGGDRSGNRAHLSWGGGPHECPAQSLAEIMIHRAIGQLLDVAPDIALADPHHGVRWRPGAFHRAVAELHVVFAACPPLRLAMPPQLQLSTSAREMNR
nr:cytochrome P450 [Nocardia jinanensis]